MASKEVWENLRSNNMNKGSDQDVLDMMSDLVDAIHLLEKIYGARESHLITSSMINDWLGLQSMATARGLTDYKRP